MNQATFDDLDGFLAAREAVGERFEVGSGKTCAIIAFWQGRGGNSQQQWMDFILDFPKVGSLSHLFLANDSSGGDPATVRAALHALYPQYVHRPNPVSQEVGV